jgi:catechol 2,3-dioxygenase-like lactoylglutathione lyase family enzyme
MPSLENLKKQAKQYLRWHRERYYPVAAIIRTYLPRFHHSADQEILAAEFKLADAQELVAREQGFLGWQALKTGAYKMMKSPEATASRPILTSVAAHLFVSDVETSCDFYTTKLGFAIDFIYGEPPFYAQVRRDNALLALRHVDKPVFAGDLREREDLLSASLTVKTADEIKALFLTYQDAQVPFHQRLRTEPWGARTFVVKDPDGNLILFAGPAA